MRTATEVVAAAGFQAWPGDTAHLSVLTAPEQRGRGLARVVATAAVADALRSDLLPQWRARPEASRRVARALGFRELGSQLSIHLASV
ncbi:GNAT family N-acetyltransferase [Dactylosporangium sp. McL0621]|uniref:GNAT family N-acetyltransferase n=1 Tax=Dactylosporangium sp. McL0621 TaxID=3415678 RepID=UPI003CEBC3FB